jgi:radical SAM protein with 4Fe4S-binding SPASM domain
MKKLDIDAHKLMFHPERVSNWKTEGDCFPIYVEIGPTNYCNHRCVFCALDYLERGKTCIDQEVMTTTLKDMAISGVKSVMFAGEGESLLHPDISQFVQTAKTEGIDVSITTNGVLFNEEKAREILPHLSWLRFSLDAGTKENYSYIHGTKESDFNRVLLNIEYAAKLKQEAKYPVEIGVQALLTNRSLTELIPLAKMLKNIGADNLQIKPYSHHPASKNDLSFDYQTAEEIRGELESISDSGFNVIYRNKTIERVCQDRDYDKCYGLPFFALIDSRGNIIPCNMFYNNEEFTYGNLYEKSFSEIWGGEKRKEVLKKIEDKGISECRKGCRLDSINKYLERIKNPKQFDNFI